MAWFRETNEGAKSEVPADRTAQGLRKHRRSQMRQRATKGPNHTVNRERPAGALTRLIL